MKNILNKIVAQKKITLQKLKSKVSLQSLQTLPLYNRTCLSLKQHLLNKNLSGIIAEFKRASPSKGIINNTAQVLDVALGYQKYGAAAISILTETHYFNGHDEDIINNRNFINIPLLKKDFIFDEYQIAHAKAIGADVVLLIAACLSPAEVNRLATFAGNLGLEVLLELHDESELEHICAATEIIGINNRNLKTFKVDIEHSLQMAKKIPAGKIKIAESGINNEENILLFRQHGFDGFLMGEHFMQQTNPALAFADFVQKLKAKENKFK